jgi:hypothetical protein
MIFSDRGTRRDQLVIDGQVEQDPEPRIRLNALERSRTMGVLPRMVLVFWLLMILGFCVYGLFVTYKTPGESFCHAMYTALTVLSGMCLFQVVEPLRQRA